MFLESMETGDYVRYKDKVVKIKNIAQYDVIDEFGNTINNVELNQPNIIISEDILMLFGFKKCNAPYTYKLSFGNNQSLIGTITYKNEPLKQVCEIRFALNNGLTKNILVLSELQDFIRINTGIEVNADIEDLSKLVQ